MDYINLIAPCGMNCALCMGFQRDKNKCPGCRQDNPSKFKSCAACIIKNCQFLKENKLKFCSSKCPNFPCKRLKALDKRYRTKYKMSMLKNLVMIETKGIRAFIKNQKQEWTCPKCDGYLCVHRDYCLNCQKSPKS